MKALVMTGMLALAGIAATANPPRSKSKGAVLNYRAMQNLQSLYGDVQNLSWGEAVNNMVRADFTTDEGKASTFFDQQGEVVATTRNISREELPVKLRNDLERRFADATVLSMIEFTNNAEHAYFVEVTQNGKTKTLKGYDFGKLSTVHLN